MSDSRALIAAHPLARPYLAGSALCPMISPTGESFVGVGGFFSNASEHFYVHERPLYRASGTGTHCLAQILKQERTTDEAIEAIATASQLDTRDIGYAGRKDRAALTTQWISAPCTPNELSSNDPNVIILSASPHEQKVKLGHLAGNLFSVYIGQLSSPELLESSVNTLKLGVPNYFGPQRFGKPWYSAPLAEGVSHPTDAHGAYVQDPLNLALDNVDRALQSLVSAAQGERPRHKKKNKRLHKLQLSALQSALFNLWLGERLRDGLSRSVIEGDVCRKVGGGTFTSTDPTEDTDRLLRGELNVLGPMLGPKLFPARGLAKAREEELYLRWGISSDLRAQMGRSWRGDRRAMTLTPLGLTARREGHGAWLNFALPAGAFATTIIGALINPQASVVRV